MTNKTENKFGGPWTQEKLDILKNYLNAYTKALKRQNFRLLYIDAFAGTGKVTQDAQDPDDKNRQEFIDGSANVALNIEDKSFDELIFIEQDEDKCQKLEQLRKEHRNRNIRVEKADANQYLCNLQRDWAGERGVLFLDPFGAQVEWATMEAIAEYKALDTWILFPTSAIARMLPRSRTPDDISLQLAHTLTRVYGNESAWRDMYRKSRQMELFGERRIERESGVENLIGIYKDQLKELFGKRFLDQSKTLKNSRNSPLYEFMFGNYIRE